MSEKSEENSEKKKPVPLQRSKTVRDKIAMFDRANIQYNRSKSENPKSTGSDSNNNEVEDCKSSDSGSKHNTMVDNIIDELIMTEEKYVEELRKIKKDYIDYLSDDKLLSHPAIIGKQCCLFGNIEEILAFSEKFLAELQSCRGNYELITETFVAYATMFELYPEYSENKLMADYYYEYIKTLINKRQKELGERLDLASYLLTPIRRVKKYVALLENMEKELRKQNLVLKNLDNAMAIVNVAMRKGNDCMGVHSIENFPVSLGEQAGSFITREKFTILKPRRFESVVFLFEEMVVVTEVLPRRIHFSYVEHIFLKDLTMVPLEQDALIFHLADYNKCKNHENREQNTHVLEAKNRKVKETFTSLIGIMLWEQLRKAKEKVLVKQGTRE